MRIFGTEKSCCGKFGFHYKTPDIKVSHIRRSGKAAETALGVLGQAGVLSHTPPLNPSCSKDLLRSQRFGFHYKTPEIKVSRIRRSGEAAETALGVLGQAGVLSHTPPLNPSSSKDLLRSKRFVSGRGGEGLSGCTGQRGHRRDTAINHTFLLISSSCTSSLWWQVSSSL